MKPWLLRAWRLTVITSFVGAILWLAFIAGSHQRRARLANDLKNAFEVTVSVGKHTFDLTDHERETLFAHLTVKEVGDWKDADHGSYNLSRINLFFTSVVPASKTYRGYTGVRQVFQQADDAWWANGDHVVFGSEFVALVEYFVRERGFDRPKLSISTKPEVSE